MILADIALLLWQRQQHAPLFPIPPSTASSVTAGQHVLIITFAPAEQALSPLRLSASLAQLVPTWQPPSACQSSKAHC